MKILIEAFNFYPVLGGVERSILEISKEFQKKGHEVSVICSNLSNKLASKETYKGIKIIRYPIPYLNKKIKFLWPLFHRKVIRKYLRALPNDFDIIFCSNFLYGGLNKKIFRNAEIIYRLPVIIKENLKSKMEVGVGFFIYSKIVERIERRTVKENKIMVYSRNLVAQIKKAHSIYSDKIRVIRPGIDMDKFNPGKGDKYPVISVCRFAPEKNLLSLVKVFQKSQNRIYLVGEGGEGAKLIKSIKQNRLEKKIILLGGKKNPEDYLKKSKIFLLTSKYEAFGLVLLEAMASGLPCIAFKPDGKKIITASDEIIKDKKTGFLVKDEKEMAEKIDLLLSDEKLRKKMGKAARKEAEKYSWEKCAEEILKFANKKPKY